ncbi:hypothetical protein PMAYCL1PPCAC_26972, partial [Pristionchus mayeri]
EFILRWEINNATAVHAAGKAESGVFNQGGFIWTTAFDKCQGNSDDAEFSLRCALNHNGPWKCKVEVKPSIIKADGTNDYSHFNQFSFTFHEENKCCEIVIENSWNLLLSE